MALGLGTVSHSSFVDVKHIRYLWAKQYCWISWFRSIGTDKSGTALFGNRASSFPFQPQHSTQASSTLVGLFRHTIHSTDFRSVFFCPVHDLLIARICQAVLPSNDTAREHFIATKVVISTSSSQCFVRDTCDALLSGSVCEGTHRSIYPETLISSAFALPAAPRTNALRP